MDKNCKSCRYNNDNYLIHCDDGGGDSHYECPQANYVDDGHGGCECTNNEAPMSTSDIALLILKAIKEKLKSDVEYGEIEEIKCILPDNLIKLTTIDKHEYKITISE